MAMPDVYAKGIPRLCQGVSAPDLCYPPSIPPACLSLHPGALLVCAMLCSALLCCAVTVTVCGALRGACLASPLPLADRDICHVRTHWLSSSSPDLASVLRACTPARPRSQLPTPHPAPQVVQRTQETVLAMLRPDGNPESSSGRPGYGDRSAPYRMGAADGGAADGQAGAGSNGSPARPAGLRQRGGGDRNGEGAACLDTCTCPAGRMCCEPAKRAEVWSQACGMLHARMFSAQNGNSWCQGKARNSWWW